MSDAAVSAGSKVAMTRSVMLTVALQVFMSAAALPGLLLTYQHDGNEALGVYNDKQDPAASLP